MISSLSRRSLLAAAGGGLVSTMLEPARAQQSGRRWTYSITDFAGGASNGWLPGFSDFSFATAPTNRIAEVKLLPEEVNPGGRYGYYLRGRNTSDDLFMFIKKPITGLEANRPYEVAFHIEFASAAPNNCVGIGGAPGESVWLKAGALRDEPVAVLENDSILLSADKGNQAAGGRDAIVVSDIANGIPCEEAEGQFVLITRTARLPNLVETDTSGTAWIFAGTDSGFEGTTEIYYAFISVLFTLQS